MLRLPFGIRDIDILADDVQRLMVAAGSKHPVRHFFCLVRHIIPAEGAGRNPYQVENIPVLADQRAVRFLRLRRRLTDKAAQTVRYKIG